MNQKNLITQLYSKKASPFINPNKKAIIKNLNSIKIIILVVVFLMFSLILGISVYANDTNNTKKFWLIDKAETSPIIFIATKGEVQKNDFLGSGIPYWPVELAILASRIRKVGFGVSFVDMFGSRHREPIF